MPAGMDFFRHGSGVPRPRKSAAPGKVLRQGPAVPWAHRRPGYPLSGCVPAEPNSVSPGQKKLPEESHRFKCPGTPEPCLENPRGSGGLVPRNLSRWPRMVEMASPANVMLRKERGLCTIEASDHPQILRTSLIINRQRGVPLAKPEGLASARASFAWPVAPG